MGNFLIDINPDIELPKYNLVLTKLTEEPITSLKNITDLEYNAFYVGIDELNFNIPFYRTEDNGDKVENEIYSLVEGDHLILVNDMKYFIINSVVEKADESGKVWKEVHCYSREYELSKKKLIDYKADSRLLYDDTNSTLDGLEKGILNYIFNHIVKSWTIGYVDPDIILREGKGIYRSLNFSNSNLTQVFNDLQRTYGCVFKFDTIKQEMNIYSIDKMMGQHRGLYISDGNFIKNISKDINTDEIITRLYIYGKDNISIQSISPTGQPYIDNFNYYKNTLNKNGQPKYMTQGLIDALDNYYTKVENYNPDFEPLLIILQEANAVMEDLINADHIDDLNQKGLVALERYLSNLQTLIDVKTEEIAIIKNQIIKATGENLIGLYDDLRAIESALDSYNTDKDNVNNLIVAKKTEINNQQQIIDGIESELKALQDELNMSNSTNFTAEQLKELDKFIKVDIYNNSDYTENNIQELYDEGKKILNKASQPKIQFEVDVVDFLSLVECQHIWDKFTLGDIVTLEHKAIGFNYDVRLVGYEYNIDDNNLTLKFSNTDNFDNASLYLENLLDDFNTTGAVVDFNKDKWNNVGSIESRIAKMIDTKLEEARQNILNAVGQRYLFDDSGLWLYKENPDGTLNNEQIRAINNTIALTKDNFNTVSTAITPDGVVAEQIYGKLGQFAKVNAEQIEVGGWDGDLVEDNLKDYIDQIKEDTDNINNTVDHIISDGFITNIEANSLKTSFENIKKEAQNIIVIADENGLSTSVERTNCYDALFGVNGLQPEINKWVGRNDYPVEITEDDRNNIINKFRILQDTMMTLAEKIRYTREEGLKNGIRTEFRAADGKIIGRVEQIESNMEDISPHNIILSNENQSFVTDSTGKVLNTTTITINIDTFKGTVRLGAIIGTPLLKNSSGAAINYGTITKTNPTSTSSGSVTWSIPANTNIASDSGWIEIPIIIQDKSYVKKLSWSKAKSGKSGTSGKDAYTIMLTNEFHNFGADSSGNIVFPTTTTTDVIAYRGTNKVNPTIGTIPTIPGLTITKSGTTITIKAEIGNNLSPNGQFDIPITVDGKLFVKTFSWTKVNDGADGSGADAKTVNITGSQVFKYTKNSVTPVPEQITFTAIPQNVTKPDFIWEYSIDGGKSFNTITGKTAATYTLLHNASIWSNNDSIVLKATIDGVSDTISVYKVRDGSNGENARLVDIILSNIYFIKDSNGITPDEITLTPEFQNTSYQKWEYSTNGTTWTSITRTTSSTIYPWMNSTTRVLTIPKGWSVLNNNDYVIFRVTTTTGEMDVQTISILYDVTELEGRVSSAEQKITPTAIMNTVQQEVSKGGTTIAQKSEIKQTVNSWTARFDNSMNLKIRYIRDWLNGSVENPSYSYWNELQVFLPTPDGNLVNIFDAIETNFGTVTANFNEDASYPFTNWTDGKTTSYVRAVGIGWKYLQWDIGAPTDTIRQIGIKHYFTNRQYNHRLEVSEDGETWYSLYDSEVDGYYEEGTTPKMYNINQIKSGITTINANGIKVEHGSSNEYSMMKADGFIRKWQYGEARYLNDIYAIEIINQGVSGSSEPPPITITLPETFYKREDETEIMLILQHPQYQLYASDITESYQIRYTYRARVIEKNFNYVNPQITIEIFAYWWFINSQGTVLKRKYMPLHTHLIAIGR